MSPSWQRDSLSGTRLAESLRAAGEVISDGVLVAVVMKGLPAEYQPFIVVTTQNEAHQTDFTKFKSALRNFEETENTRSGNGNDNVMFNRGGQNGRGKGRNGRGGKQNGGGQRFNKSSQQGQTCFSCDEQGHKSDRCSERQNGSLYCRTCKTNSHNEAACRKKKKAGGDTVKTTADGQGHGFSFFSVMEEKPPALPPPPFCIKRMRKRRRSWPTGHLSASWGGPGVPHDSSSRT